MPAISTITLLALMLSALLGGIGVIHLLRPRFVRAAYERWDYPQRLPLIVGLAEIAAALLLDDPALRGWGIGLAALINFGAVVTHLNHSQYLHAVPAVLMMVALVPLGLAIPRASYPVRVMSAVLCAAPSQPAGMCNSEAALATENSAGKSAGA
jgi:hypothetical protein